MPRTLTRLLTSAAFAALMAIPVSAESLTGSYLAARHAALNSDFEAAAQYYTRALTRDPSNPIVLENALTSQVNLGRIDKALPIAQQLLALGTDSQVANLVVLADLFQREDYAGVVEALSGGMSIMPLIDGLALGWAHIGTGDLDAANAAFDGVIATEGLANFGLYHKALGLAVAGDFEAADVIFSGEAGDTLRLDRRGIEARLQVLSQLERNADALDLIEKAFGGETDAQLDALRKKFEAGAPVDFDVVASARDGMAEVFHMVGAVLSAEAAPGYTLLFARAAEYLNPRHVDAILLSADLLDRLEQYGLATRAYDQVPRDHPAFYSAELGRADALRKDGKPDAAIEVLQQLTESHGDLPVVHMALGDALRREERYPEATRAYDRAVALYETPQAASWRTYYVRGITLEREGRWDEAEADFRTALTLQPNEPRVLNYLGYSMLEMQIKLDEALEMIQTAVKASPDSGYIIDSLAWAYYRLGRYDEAVPEIEKAVELMPLDSVVNDHVGDIYWAVGRTREAEFQWKRALSLDPKPEEAERIRRKLEVGLDRVLEEEGAEPLKVANDDG